MPTSDHDMLVTLVETVRSLRDEVRNARLDQNTGFNDHETRIRTLEGNSISWPKLLATLAAIGAVLGGLWWLVK